jgi:hypothetical protein
MRHRFVRKQALKEFRPLHGRRKNIVIHGKKIIIRLLRRQNKPITWTGGFDLIHQNKPRITGFHPIRNPHAAITVGNNNLSDKSIFQCALDQQRQVLRPVMAQQDDGALPAAGEQQGGIMTLQVPLQRDMLRQQLNRFNSNCEFVPNAAPGGKSLEQIAVLSRKKRIHCKIFNKKLASDRHFPVTEQLSIKFRVAIRH